jgi:protein ImuB
MALRCPELCSPLEQPQARLFEQVIAVVTEFCPWVEVTEPGVCAFGAGGPARYFGGETTLAAKLMAAVTALGVECRIGVADGMFAALLAARDASPAPAAARGVGPAAAAADGGGVVRVIPRGETPGFLARQPVNVLEDPDLAGLLRRLGLDTLGDFAALPADDVAARFGNAGAAAHRLARGLDLRPLAARPPADDLSVVREFDPPVALSEPVVFAAKALAERMHVGLAAHGLSCVRVEVRVTWQDGRESSRLWRHDGLLSAAGVADRVRWQLDGCRPAHREQADGGIALLRLVPDQVVRATGHQLALWGESAVSDRVARAAMRIQAMLGHEAVLHPVTGGGRNVADQVTHVPFGEKKESSLAAGQPWPGRIMGAAPGVVYPVAREALVTDDAGGLVTVSGRCAISAPPAWLAVGGGPPRRVTGWAGPWPLAERWWQPPVARRRARFQLATEDGRAWLAVIQNGRWLIEAGYW